jgi:hypothetical protein
MREAEAPSGGAQRGCFIANVGGCPPFATGGAGQQPLSETAMASSRSISWRLMTAGSFLRFLEVIDLGGQMVPAQRYLGQELKADRTFFFLAATVRTLSSPVRPRIHTQ